MLKLHIVNHEGTRSSHALIGAAALDELKQIAAFHDVLRFVVLDDKGVQVYASDERDATGAYMPHGY